MLIDSRRMLVASFPILLEVGNGSSDVDHFEGEHQG